MMFYLVDMYEETPKTKNVVFPCVALQKNGWDDFGYETLFSLHYNKTSSEIVNIGPVKILNKKRRITRNQLENSFETLGNDFCSLGQNLQYYENLSKLGEETAILILKSLNDIAIFEENVESFEDEEGLHSSLLRFSEAEKAYKEGKQYFGESIEKKFNFTFSTKMPSATKEHQVAFDFSQERYLPYRMNVIIGKNGTGKTQLLARLASTLSGFDKRLGSIDGGRPSFSKVLAISYSPFDDFEKPSEAVYSYKYCGIRKLVQENASDNKRVEREGYLTNEERKVKFEMSLKKIRDRQREDEWREILETIIEPEHRYIIGKLINGPYSVDLSSGQNVIIYTVTEVIADIEKDSIILFDEPETHLHPNAISNLVQMLYSLLERYESYAIISTHSPIIVQETPSRYVNVIERISNTPIVSRLEIESFGENLSSITNTIFQVRNTESNYRYWLTKMYDNDVPFERVLEMFDLDLSFNARTFLKSLYKER